MSGPHLKHRERAWKERIQRDGYWEEIGGEKKSEAHWQRVNRIMEKKGWQYWSKHKCFPFDQCGLYSLPSITCINVGCGGVEAPWGLLIITLTKQNITLLRQSGTCRRLQLTRTAHYHVKAECSADSDYHWNFKCKTVFCFRWGCDWLVMPNRRKTTRTRFYFPTSNSLCKAKQQTRHVIFKWLLQMSTCMVWSNVEDKVGR